MEKDFKFAIEDIQKLNIEEYDENEYCVGRMKFLSTRPNSHGLKFSEEVLRRDAKTMLGKWVVAEILAWDFTTHVPNEHIIGIVPKEQDIELVEAEDGYLDAYADVVLSKRYAKDAYDIFVKDNDRSVSIEFNYSHPEEDEQEVGSFIIRGVTVLGKSVNPSVPTANLTITRFSEEEADKFFAKVHNNSLTVLKKFVEERKESMAEQEKYVSHPIDTSKEAMYDGEWEGQKAKQELVKEKNFKTLAPKVCMKLEPGWEDREVTKLGYPVMMLHDGKWVYSTKGLASALGYAKKEDETEVINKVEKIYKKLGLDSDRKEEDAEMAEIEFAAVNIGELWNNVWNVVHKHSDWRYSVEGIYEQDNKKFAILKDGEGNLYRLDFTLTEEEGLVASDTIVEVKQEFIETDDIKKFAEPENVAKYKKFEDDDSDDEDDDDKDNEDKEEKMSEEDMMAKISELQKSIEERDNIIMEKDTCMKEMETELSELREFKKTCMEKEKACSVESVMNEVKEFMDDEQFKSLRDEGLACDFAQIDAWTNKVKAISFESVKNKKQTKPSATTGIMWFSAATDNSGIKVNSFWK